MSNVTDKEIDVQGVEDYKAIIDYLPMATIEELKGIALETAKSNPTFFMMALAKVRNTPIITSVQRKVPLPIVNSPSSVSPSGLVLISFDDGQSHTIDINEFVGVIRVGFTTLNSGAYRKVDAIKQMRLNTSPIMGLREAKCVVDYIYDNYDINLYGGDDETCMEWIEYTVSCNKFVNMKLP